MMNGKIGEQMKVPSMLELNRRRAGTVDDGPSFEIVRVTPELAAKLVAANHADNRPISQFAVSKYARDMAAGRWVVTHQGIAINRAGQVVDGQHRLLAVIESGVPVHMAIVTGCNLEYDSPLDQGRARTAAHVLHKNKRWVAAVRALVHFELGSTRNQGRGGCSVGEIAGAYDRHQGPVDAVWSSFGAAMAGGVLAALIWTHPVNPDGVLSFGVQVRDGELLEKDDPAYALRRWLERNRRHDVGEVAAATFSALRAALLNDKLGAVYDGETGYRWVCTKRRVAKVPHTPASDRVAALTSGPSSLAEGRRANADRRRKREAAGE